MHSRNASLTFAVAPARIVRSAVEHRSCYVIGDHGILNSAARYGGDTSMSETAPDEPGLMGRPFERKRADASEGPDTGTGDRAKPAEPELPREISASRSEGAP